MLTSYDLDSQSLVSIVLVGHESFLDRLKLPAYQPLNQRIGVRNRLTPWTFRIRWPIWSIISRSPAPPTASSRTPSSFIF